MLIGYETTVLIKLWYWVADTNIRTLREVKRLQLLVLGSPGSVQGSQATAFGEGDGGSLWDHVSRRKLEWVSFGVLIAAGVALGLYLAGG